jgi:hypothetical protein
LLIGPIEAKLKATVVVAPLILPRLGLRLQQRKIHYLCCGFRRIVSSGKNNGLVTPDVMRNPQA